MNLASHHLVTTPHRIIRPSNKIAKIFGKQGDERLGRLVPHPCKRGDDAVDVERCRWATLLKDEGAIRLCQ
jgi:hypothetical protein